MSDEFDKAKGKPKTDGGQLATGVTGSNYGQKGSAFIAANPFRCYTIINKPSTIGGEITADGLKRWGAWLAYFKRIGYQTKFMEGRAYWTVPAEWPHEFDASATVSGDHLAGEAYLEKRRLERIAECDLTGPIKRATVLQGLGYDPSRRRTSSAPAVHTDPIPESSAELKTPARPPSPEFLAAMKRQGYKVPEKPKAEASAPIDPDNGLDL